MSQHYLVSNSCAGKEMGIKKEKESLTSTLQENINLIRIIEAEIVTFRSYGYNFFLFAMWHMGS